MLSENKSERSWKGFIDKGFYFLQQISSSKPRYIGKIYASSDANAKNTLVIATNQLENNSMMYMIYLEQQASKACWFKHQLSF